MKMRLKLWAKNWKTAPKFNKRLISKLHLSLKNIKKTKQCLFRVPNSELGTLFYGAIAFILYIFSLYSTIRRLKQVAFAELVKFSIENYDSTDSTQSNVKSFLFENFLAPIVFVFASIIFAFMFAYCILFKIGNMGNDDQQLGIDLILIDGILSSNKYENNSKNSSSTILNLNEIEEMTDNSKSSSPIVNSSSHSSISSVSSRHSSSSPLPNETRVNDDFINKKINVMPKIYSDKSIDFFNTISLMNAKKETYFHNLSNKSKMYFFYLPAFNSCFHLMMCLCLLVTKLQLNQFDKSVYSNPIQKQSHVENHIRSDLNSLKLIRYFYMNRNNTKLIDHLFNELNEKIISNKNLNLDSNSTSKLFNFKKKVPNKFQIDSNFINYSLAFLVFSLKFTRIYSRMNLLYATLVLVHLLLFMISNLTMYPALEIICKNNLKHQKNISTSDSIFDTLKNESFISNSHLYKLVPSAFDNQKFMMVTYVLSWLLNLIYLASLNVFATSFYKDAQLKIKYKFESYLNYYSANETKSNVLGESGKKIIYDNNIVNPFLLQSNQTDSIVLYHGNDDDGSGTKQYKAIIGGIFLLLLTETFRLPFVYSCYIKYFIYSFDVYFLALSFQLVYLLFNAIFWIILSFKKEWSVHFTPQFRILLWHELYSQYFNRDNRFSPNKQTNLNRNSPSSQTLSTEMSKYDSALEDTQTGFSRLLTDSREKKTLSTTTEKLGNKPTISKLKQRELNNSLKKNSKLFKKKQKNIENNYCSMKHERQMEKNNIFVIENQSNKKSFGNGANYLLKKEVYFNKKTVGLKNKNEKLDECTSSDSSNSSSSNNELKKSSIEMCPNSINSKTSYFTKEYISVPTYTTACDLKVCDQYMPTYRKTFLEPITESQTPYKPHSGIKNNFSKKISDDSGENRFFAPSQRNISSKDFLREQENQWKAEQNKKLSHQKNKKFNGLPFNLNIHQIV